MKLDINLAGLEKLRISHNKEFDEKIESFKKAYLVDIVKCQEELLLKISTEHKLDYNELHEKYIKNYIKNYMKNFKKNSKKNQLIEDGSDSESAEIKNNLIELEDETNVLEKIEVDGKTCFIENKEGGTIYDKDVIKIGEVKEGNFLLYTK